MPTTTQSYPDCNRDFEHSIQSDWTSQLVIGSAVIKSLISKSQIQRTTIRHQDWRSPRKNIGTDTIFIVYVGMNYPHV